MRDSENKCKSQVYIPCGKENTEVRITQNKGKERENSCQKINILAAILKESEYMNLLNDIVSKKTKSNLLNPTLG